ncbi:unnamed protein product [Meloidogyne enterolobii]|uniref:Uncharacterized protein n=1 Tax=Meloidogyne enterolobii TaxID=390850 RepID=A0ACB0Y5A1_MELEN
MSIEYCRQIAQPETIKILEKFVAAIKSVSDSKKINLTLIYDCKAGGDDLEKLEEVMIDLKHEIKKISDMQKELAKGNTILLITNSSGYQVLEAFYENVPILSLPYMVDQFYVAEALKIPHEIEIENSADGGKPINGGDHKHGQKMDGNGRSKSPVRGRSPAQSENGRSKSPVRGRSPAQSENGRSKSPIRGRSPAKGSSHARPSSLDKHGENHHLIVKQEVVRLAPTLSFNNMSKNIKKSGDNEAIEDIADIEAVLEELLDGSHKVKVNKVHEYLRQTLKKNNPKDIFLAKVNEALRNSNGENELD